MAPCTTHPNYPVNLVLTDRPCLVVGGGSVAVRKIEGLLASGAVVTVVAPEIRSEIDLLGPVNAVRREYRTGDLDGFVIAITCTDDADVNARVYVDGLASGTLVNSADDPTNCAFTLPSVARQGDLSIAISTAGRSPALAMWLRRRFEVEFDERYGRLLDVLAEVRTEIRAKRGTSEVSGWIEGLDDGVLELITSGDDDGAADRLRAHLGLLEGVTR